SNRGRSNDAIHGPVLIIRQLLREFRKGTVIRRVAELLRLKWKCKLVQALEYVLDFTAVIGVEKANAHLVLEKPLSRVARDVSESLVLVDGRIWKLLECEPIDVLTFLVLVTLNSHK